MLASLLVSSAITELFAIEGRREGKWLRVRREGSPLLRNPGKRPLRYGSQNIFFLCHIIDVEWSVELAVEFEGEFDDLAEDVQTELAAQARLLRKFGPQLGRPRVDTLNGSKFSNMKELRFSADGGEWRVAFAFDVERSAILLVAGDKSGGSEKRFYRELIRKADERFADHKMRQREKDKRDGKKH